MSRRSRSGTALAFSAPASASLCPGPSLDRATLEWAIDLIGQSAIKPAMQRFVLAPHAPGETAAASPVVCSCFTVRQDAIVAAIANGSDSVETVEQATGAGMNCGSCPRGDSTVGAPVKPSSRAACACQASRAWRSSTALGLGERRHIMTRAYLPPHLGRLAPR